MLPSVAPYHIISAVELFGDNTEGIQYELFLNLPLNHGQASMMLISVYDLYKKVYEYTEANDNAYFHLEPILDTLLELIHRVDNEKLTYPHGIYVNTEG